jgi:hypothetical protein
MTTRSDYTTSIRQSLDNYEARQAIEQAPERGWETDRLEQLDRLAKALAEVMCGEAK